MRVASPSPRSPVVARSREELERGLISLVPELRGRAMRLTGSPAVAEDVVQDAIERALKFAAQYESGTNLRAWAHQILFSVFVTRYRRARRERNALRSLTADPCAWTVPSGGGSPEKSAGLTRSTKARLSALPGAFREVVELVDLGDLTYREAATTLGVPVGTVMSRLHRGRKLLAGVMAEAA